MPKKGGGLIGEDWTFDIFDQQYYIQEITSQKKKWESEAWKESGISQGIIKIKLNLNKDKIEKICLRRVHL